MHPQDLDYVCLSCWITSEAECADMTRTKANRLVCPRRRLAAVKLEPGQWAELKRLSKRYRDPEYRLRHFVRMAEIQDERNRVPVGGLNA